MKIAAGVILVLVLLGGAYLYFNNSPFLPVENESGMAQYTSEKYGLSFAYPKHYYLEEKELGNGERWHHAIVLTEDTEENKQVREGKSPGREGPTAITIDIYQNNLDGFSVERWVKETNDSNFKMSTDGLLTPIKISTLDGLAYRWSGLYEANVAVVAHEEAVFMFTATYLTPDDQILKDFSEILKGVTLSL